MGQAPKPPGLAALEGMSVCYRQVFLRLFMNCDREVWRCVATPNHC